MPPIDVSIYQNLLRPPKSVAEYDAEAMQGQQNRLALQMGQQKADEYTRSVSDGNKLRQVVSGFGADKGANYNALLQAGRLPDAQAYAKQNADIGKIESDTRENTSKTAKLDLEAVGLASQQHKDMLGAVGDPQTAAQWVAAAYNDPRLAAISAHGGTLEQAIARIPTDPAKFQEWKMQSSLGADKLIEYSRANANTVATNATSAANNAATNATSRANNAATVGATIRGQNMTDTRAKEAAEGKEASFTTGAIDNAAARYNIDGTLPPMGMGNAGSQARSAILNRAAELAGTNGLSPDEQRIAQIGNKGNAAAISKLQQQKTMVGAFERNFNMNADIVKEFSAKVDRTGVPIMNKWINAGKRAVAGDPELSAFDASVKAVSNEYAKIVSGSMGNTALAEGEIKKIEGLLNAAQTPQQVTAVVNLMQRETHNRMQGFDDEMASLRESMKPKKAGAAKPSLSEIFK